MQNLINYTINSLIEPQKKGLAKKIHIKDSLNPLEILTNFGTTITTLENGEIHIFESNSQIEKIPYKEAFLQVENNQCNINILY